MTYRPPTPNLSRLWVCAETDGCNLYGSEVQRHNMAKAILEENRVDAKM